MNLDGEEKQQSEYWFGSASMLPPSPYDIYKQWTEEKESGYKHMHQPETLWLYKGADPEYSVELHKFDENGFVWQLQNEKLTEYLQELPANTMIRGAIGCI